MTPDLAIIGTPPQPVPSLVSALGKRGTRAVIVLTVGMSGQRDGAGTTTLEAMLAAARPYNLWILGPNSFGLVIPGIGLMNASFFHRSALPGKIAFVSPSGGMCTGILDWASAKGIGFSHFIALGECADVGFAEVIDFLSMEPSTKAILLFMKTLVHARGFMSAARAAPPAISRYSSSRPRIVRRPAPSARRKPAPRSNRMRSTPRPFGVPVMLQACDTEELFAAVETLARSGPLRSDDLTIMTNSGGIGTMVADSLNQGGGNLARFTDETQEQLEAVLPMVRPYGNPLDIRADATAERYADVLRVLVAAREAKHHSGLAHPDCHGVRHGGGRGSDPGRVGNRR